MKIVRNIENIIWNLCIFIQYSIFSINFSIKISPSRVNVREKHIYYHCRGLVIILMMLRRWIQLSTGSVHTTTSPRLPPGAVLHPNHADRYDLLDQFLDGCWLGAWSRHSRNHHFAHHDYQVVRNSGWGAAGLLRQSECSQLPHDSFLLRPSIIKDLYSSVAQWQRISSLTHRPTG